MRFEVRLKKEKSSTFQYTDIKITRLNSLSREIFLSNFINFINETINFLIEFSMRFEVRLKKKEILFFNIWIL